MNNIPIWMWDVWYEGDFSGNNRPVTRATISRSVLKATDGIWRTALFGQTGRALEIPNIVSCSIDRRLGTDAATMSLIMRNQNPLDVEANLDLNYQGGVSSPTRRDLKDLGEPGYYSYRRGVAIDSDGVNPWSHDQSQWVDMIIPNRVIHTFQGYGTDGSLPHLDSRLTLTGIWLIDRVEFSADGTIKIDCRDFAKFLIEQRLYPPIIPLSHYPLEICADHSVLEPLPGPNLAQAYTGGAGLQTSTQFRVGVGGSIHGHVYSDAFDGNLNTYWLSGGYPAADRDDAYEWIQIDVAGGRAPIKQVRFYQKLTNIYSGGYDIFVSVYGRPFVEGADPPAPGDMGWLGNETIPYVAGEVFPDNLANMPYVLKTHSSTYEESWQTINLPTRYEVEAVRLTFHSLNLTSYGQEDNVGWRVAVAEIEIRDVFPQPVPVEGNINDYTDIVKILCGWSGFYWPEGAPQDPSLLRFGNTSGGRVWGDFFYSGAFPVDPACIPPSYWDNKSVMDGINQIKEVLGFIFLVDSHGAVQWRPPNIWRTGNYVAGIGYVGEQSVPTIDEEKVLIDYGVTIDDENPRSDIIVISAEDPTVHGSFRPGFAQGETSGDAISDVALLSGQQRVMLIANYPFGTADNPRAKAEIEKFAFLISLWIHWSYRKSKFRIPGNPGLAVDDQVRIYERVTSETYVHYVEGISSRMDVEKGTWFMDVDTHWLGNGPDQEWIIKATNMHPALFAYLKAVDQIPEDLDPSQFPEGWEVFEIPDYESDPPILDENLEELFPDPPPLQWPEETWSTEDPQGDPFSGGGGSGGGTPTTGSVYNCSNGAKFEYWGDHGQYSDQFLFRFANLNSFPGQTADIILRVDRRARPAWLALREAIFDAQYVLHGGQCWGYNDRKIAGSNQWSNHAWGHAVDLNSVQLPQGSRAPASHPVWGFATKVINGIRCGNGQRVFRWGGTWSNPDPMHFEICCSPADIASGVSYTP